MRHRHDHRGNLNDRDYAAMRRIAAATITPGLEDLAAQAGLKRPAPPVEQTTAPKSPRKRGRR